MARSGRQKDQDQAIADFGQTRGAVEYLSGALNFEPSLATCILGKISRMEAFNEQFFPLFYGPAWADGTTLGRLSIELAESHEVSDFWGGMG